VRLSISSFTSLATKVLLSGDFAEWHLTALKGRLQTQAAFLV
jgi:hypothetical protein